MGERVVDQAASIIRDYLAAYEAANKKKPDFEMVYEQGWFLWKEDKRPWQRARKTKILQAIENLKSALAEESAKS